MKSCPVFPSAPLGSENILMDWKYILDVKSLIYLMVSLLVATQTYSTPEGFLALIAGKNNSCQMSCFNVVLYGTAHAFLSTYFAYISLTEAIGIIVLTLLHHRFHPFIQLL